MEVETTFIYSFPLDGPEKKGRESGTRRVWRGRVGKYGELHNHLTSDTRDSEPPKGTQSGVWGCGDGRRN